MLTLGFETSCDETAASVVKDGSVILSNIVLSSIELHREFGGVVPEIAHRFHSHFINKVAEDALAKAEVNLEDVDLISATYGPGLIGALIVGLSFGKAVSFARKIPFLGVNHLHAHLYSAAMSSKLKFPYIGLIISGGHTALVLVKNFDSYVLLGQTQDDAAGEAFDKVAKVLDLGYPGGPAIDKISKGVKIEEVVDFPRSYLHKESADFSFSGLKTAVLYYVRDNYKGKKITEKEKAKIAAGFQESVIDVLIHKSLLACSQNNIDRLALGGGVSSNSRLRDRLLKEAKSTGVKVFFPEEQLCQDNAAMIAGLAAKLYDMGYSSDFYISCEATLSV